jgi:hypothetical protein
MVQYLLCHLYTSAPDIMMCYVQLPAFQNKIITLHDFLFRFSYSKLLFPVLMLHCFNFPASAVHSATPFDKMTDSKGDLRFTEYKDDTSVFLTFTVLPFVTFERRESYA